MQTRAGIRDEGGMTLVEVMVAMVVLVIGALGVLSMLDTGNQVTRENLARDGATALAREQLERARDMTYATLAYPSQVASSLASALDDSDPAVVATFVTRRRNITYTTTVSSCVLDDPSDGIGAATGTPCQPVDCTVVNCAGVHNPNPSSASSLLNVNVLGISVDGAGSVVDAVCALLPRNDSTLNSLIGQGGALSSLVSTGADVGVCSSGAQVALDRQPNDVTAVTSTVTWSSPRAGRVVQRALVSGPRVSTT
jgi:prepilin-type N-terminal cleavage/methylation domain-containing protein